MGEAWPTVSLLSPHVLILPFFKTGTVDVAQEENGTGEIAPSSYKSLSSFSTLSFKERGTGQGL